MEGCATQKTAFGGRPSGEIPGFGLGRTGSGLFLGSKAPAFKSDGPVQPPTRDLDLFLDAHELHMA